MIDCIHGVGGGGSLARGVRGVGKVSQLCLARHCVPRVPRWASTTAKHQNWTKLLVTKCCSCIAYVLGLIEDTLGDRRPTPASSVPRGKWWTYFRNAKSSHKVRIFYRRIATSVHEDVHRRAISRNGLGSQAKGSAIQMQQMIMHTTTNIEH